MATVRLQFSEKTILGHMKSDGQMLALAPQVPLSPIPLPRHRHSREGTLAGRGGVLTTLGSALVPFRKVGRQFVPAMLRKPHRADRSPGNHPSAREAGRFRPNVSQFVDTELTGSDRRLERRRSPSLRGERLTTAMHTW